MSQPDDQDPYGQYRGKVVETVTTHRGSIAFQKMLPKASVNTLSMIIDEIKDDFGNLMSN